MIHHRFIHDVPHLQLADRDCLAVMVTLAVDDEVEPAGFSSGFVLLPMVSDFYSAMDSE
jgi:hypothetical protein